MIYLFGVSCKCTYMCTMCVCVLCLCVFATVHMCAYVYSLCIHRLNAEEVLDPSRVATWLSPSLHEARGSNHHWSGIFSAFNLDEFNYF